MFILNLMGHASQGIWANPRDGKKDMISHEDRNRPMDHTGPTN